MRWWVCLAWMFVACGGKDDDGEDEAHSATSAQDDPCAEGGGFPCDDGCSALDDDENCGACGNACLKGEACDSQQCVPVDTDTGDSGMDHMDVGGIEGEWVGWFSSELVIDNRFTPCGSEDSWVPVGLPQSEVCGPYFLRVKGTLVENDEGSPRLYVDQILEGGCTEGDCDTEQFAGECVDVFEACGS